MTCTCTPMSTCAECAEKMMGELPPLPEPDGTAEANKEPHPNGGYTYDVVDAWSEPLVRRIVAAAVAKERERCALICESEPERLRGDGIWAADQTACAIAIRATQATQPPPAAS